jgi:hypothetical protein
MYTQLSTKLAALAVALMMNGTMIGTIAYLFNGQLHGSVATAALVQASVPTASGQSV